MRVVERGESCGGVSSVREAVLQSALHHVVVVQPRVGAHDLGWFYSNRSVGDNDDLLMIMLVLVMTIPPPPRC